MMCKNFQEKGKCQTDLLPTSSKMFSTINIFNNSNNTTKPLVNVPIVNLSTSISTPTPLATSPSTSNEYDDVFFPPIIEESFAEKFTRKFKADPLVPVGAGLTAIILFGGLKSFATKQVAGQAAKQQKFMRARVAMQGVTVAILAYGTFYAAVRDNFNKKEREAMGAPQYKLAGEATYRDAAETVHNQKRDAKRKNEENKKV